MSTFGDTRLPARFWDKIETSDNECWMWTSAQWGRGYGCYWLDGRAQAAHRVAYVALVGLIPEGLHIDHLCRTPLCVNPDHMEPVTNEENIMRGEGVGAKASRMTHCIRGHEYNQENTYYYPGRRLCKICQAMRTAAYKDRMKAQG